MSGPTEKFVKDCMSTQLTTLPPDENLAEALIITCSANVRHVPIVKDRKLVGIISDRDIKRHLPTRNQAADVWQSLEATKIDEIMTRNVRCVDGDATLREAALIMMKEKINALPITDEEGRLQGLITSDDILWAFILDQS